MQGWLIVVIIVVAVLGVGGGIGYFYISKEHREVQSLSLNIVDFDRLKDGVYRGEYAGGIYAWRTNECEVTVERGKVTDIRLISSKEFEEENADLKALYDRVIGAQSLQVDTISGATLTSKAHLQGIENALIPAQEK